MWYVSLAHRVRRAAPCGLGVKQIDTTASRVERKRTLGGRAGVFVLVSQGDTYSSKGTGRVFAPVHSLRQVGGCAGVFVLAPCAPPEMVMPVLLYIGIEALMGWRASCRVRRASNATCNVQQRQHATFQNS